MYDLYYFLLVIQRSNKNENFFSRGFESLYSELLIWTKSFNDAKRIAIFFLYNQNRSYMICMNTHTRIIQKKLNDAMEKTRETNKAIIGTSIAKQECSLMCVRT